MSAPARTLPTPDAPTTRDARPARRPAFWFLAALLISALVLAVVSLNAMVVNTTYRMTEVQQRVQALEERHERLDIEVARLSSPSRIAEWADVVGMVVPRPGESVIVRVPGERTGSKAPKGNDAA